MPSALGLVGIILPSFLLEQSVAAFSTFLHAAKKHVFLLFFLKDNCPPV